MSNPFVHMELNTSDLEKAKKFYGEMFGWEFTDNNMPTGVYSTFKPSTGPGGGMFSAPDPNFNGWGVYVGVDDIKAATDKAAALGATVCMSCYEIPHVGWMSVLTDPTGARVQLFQPMTPQG